MNRLPYFSIIFSFFALLLAISPATVLAQTVNAPDDTTSSSISALPTLLPPTSTPAPSQITSFSVLQTLTTLTNPIASTSSVATVAAMPTISPTIDATLSATPTPDIVASGSAQDYCLNVPIIMYHHVEPLDIATQLGHAPLTEDSAFFEEHINYLVSHHYHLLSLETLVHAILEHKTVPAKSAVITIDDGYIDAYTYAFLMAKKYHAVMNFMVPTGLVGQPDYLTWDHLKEMAASPYAKIYNHTTTHAALGLIDQDQIVTEISTANQDLLKNLGIKNDIVVYPYGSYNDLAMQTVQQMGMIAAVSTDPGTNDCISNIYKLPRVRVGNEPIEDYGY